MNVIQQYKNNALISDVTELKTELSEKFLEPHLSELEDFCFGFRLMLDESIRKRDKTTVNKPFHSLIDKGLKDYPIGRCREITNSFLIYLEAHKPTFIKQFTHKGGVVKRVWGNIRDEFFQTAVQMGDYLVDVSNDTVDVSKSKVDISKLKEIQFKNITTFEEFIAVKERYHDVKIYINNIVPHIFSDYPLFERNKSGGLTIIQNPCCKYLIDVLKVFPPENLPKIKGDEAKRIKHFFSMKSKIFETEEQKKATIHKMVALYNFSK